MIATDTSSELFLTFTCQVHGTKTTEDDFGLPMTEGKCCHDAWGAQLKWEILIERMAGCAAQNVQNKAYSDAGEWAGPAYVLATEAEIMEWAASEIERDDEEFDYGFNVLYYEMRDRD